MKPSYIITDNNITVNYNGETHIVSRKDSLAEQLLNAIRSGQEDQIPDLVSAAKKIVDYGQGDFEVKNHHVLIDGQPVHDVLSNKILDFQSQGLPHKPLVNFARNLMKNPSHRAVNELFLFLEANNHPLTEDGNFIAYKRVRPDFKDIHSGTMDNSVGNVVEMPRNQVDEDCNRTCSTGLHVANWDYSYNNFGSKSDTMLEVEVNPEHVVAVPTDYNNAKMRVCKYKVLGVVQNPHDNNTHLRNVNPVTECTTDCGEDQSDDDYEEPIVYCVDCRAEVEDGWYRCLDCDDDSRY